MDTHASARSRSPWCDDLESLEQMALHGGSAIARIPYAGALVRVGRRDAALEVLLPAMGEPAVRPEIARLPAWTHSNGDAGGTCFADLPPVEGKPREMWSRRLRQSPDYLLASPLGIVVGGRRGTAIVDPDSGEIRAELLPSAPPVLAGLTLLCWTRPMLWGYDLWTGSELYATKFRRGFDSLSIAEGVVARLSDRGVKVNPFTDSRLPPGRDGAWNFTLPREGQANGRAGVIVTRDHVLVHGVPDILAINRATGAAKWRAPGESPLVDRAGLVATFPGRGIGTYRFNGSPRWIARGPMIPVALTPDVILVAGAPGAGENAERLVNALDRKTGRTSREIGVCVGRPIVARDTVYLPNGRTLSAVTLRGEPLWRIGLRSPVVRLAPLSHRVCVLGADGTLVCLE